jgi:hypothetical protein
VLGNSNIESTLRFIVNSVSVDSKVIGVIENGKDKWCYWNFPFYLTSILYEGTLLPSFHMIAQPEVNSLSDPIGGIAIV